jgi:hypothetical protein
MAFSDLFAIEILLAAFAGGAFGAALGSLPAFIFAGFMVIAGEAANLATEAVAEAGNVDPTALGTAGITGSVAFGPTFSPAVAFAAGAAATAYAAKKGYMESGFDYHNAKDIPFALGTKPDVLVVGGLFGILGQWVVIVASTLALPTDPIALGVVISAVVHRLALGYDLIGEVRGDGILDMTPFDRGDLRVMGTAATDGSGTDDAATTDPNRPPLEDGGRLAVEPWLPHQYKWPNVLTLGLVTGLLAGFIGVRTGSFFLAFGISAATLVFLNCGVERTPVTHHMTLPGSTAAIAVTADGSGLLAGGAGLAVLVGGVFGVLGAVFGELVQRVFYAHGDTHFDPPAASIVMTATLIAVLNIVGILPSSGYVPT